MSDWIFELAQSSNMSKIGELTQARSRSHTPSLNRGGATSMQLPLTDEIAMEIVEGSTCVIIRFDDQIVWSGPVWTARDETPDMLSISCVGWIQTLEKRVTKPAWGNPLTYTAQDAGDIALDLLALSNADNTVGTNYVTPGAAETTQNRTKSIQPWSGVLSEIIALSDLESGYDMIVDPTTRKLNIYARVGEEQTEVFFEYGGAAQNVQRECDISRMCNRMHAYSSVGYAVAEDLDSQAEFGLHEEAVSLSDVTDVTILQAYADAEVAVRGVPLRFHTFEPRPPSFLNPLDPRIFRDFGMGDTVYVKAERGRLQVPKQAVRIFGGTVTWPDDGSGTERLGSVQTTAS